MPAILFGSISSVADTSELQRDAFNRAFTAHGLDWHWDRDHYRRMLTGSGGRGRVEEYARSRGETVDATAVHDTKSKIFQESLAGTPLTARPGVADVIRDAKAAGWAVGLVTTTSRANVESLLDGLAGEVSAADLDVVVDADSVDAPKPDPAAYAFALERLGEQPTACVAVEDNVGGVRAAQAAGVPCVAFPNQNTAGHDFGSAQVVDRLSFTELADLATTG
jgi:HAD superfamily hydrolase (TIGR01509 family)